MAYIIELANALKKKTDEFEFKTEKKKWQPNELPSGLVKKPDFNVPKKRINEYRKLLTFIKERLQFLRVRDGITSMVIPTTSDFMMQFWSNGSRGTKLMEEIGLISRFKKVGRTLLWAYFYENEQKFIQYCLKNNIKPLKIKNKRPKKTSTIDVEKFRSRAVITSNVRLYKPSGMSMNEFQDKIFSMVYDNYPEIEECQKIADEINEKYYSEQPEFKIHCELKAKWNPRYDKSGNEVKKRCITKIKFRPSNSYCSMETEAREKLLDELGYRLSSDVNCSVPRLNKSMNIGKWFRNGPNNYFDDDFYKLIFEEMYPNETFTPEDRKALKKLLLRTYFEKHEGNLLNHVWRKLEQSKVDETKAKAELLKLDKAVKKVAGPLMLGSNIYYVEACVYLRVLKDLLESGYHVWLIYDGFYSDGYLMNDLFDAYVQGLIEIKFNEFYKRYVDDLKNGRCVEIRS